MFSSAEFLSDQPRHKYHVISNGIISYVRNWHRIVLPVSYLTPFHLIFNNLNVIFAYRIIFLMCTFYLLLLRAMTVNQLAQAYFADTLKLINKNSAFHDEKTCNWSSKKTKKGYTAFDSLYNTMLIWQYCPEQWNLQRDKIRGSTIKQFLLN